MKYLYKNKHWAPNKEYNIDKLLYLTIDRPDRPLFFNEISWENKKRQCHRNYDLPSSVYYCEDGSCNLSWNVNNKYNRKNNKPAIIYYNGYKEYWINDNFIKLEKSI